MAPKPTPYRAANGDVTWKVRFRVEGQKWPTMETFTTQREADKFAALVEQVGGAAARAARHRGEDSARTMPTLRTWLDTHLESVASHASQGTAPGYRAEAERTWLPLLGDTPVDAITRDAVVKWVAWQREQETSRSIAARARARKAGKPVPEPVKVKPKTIRNAHGLLSSVLSAAVDAELIARNPARKVRLPSDATSSEKEILTQAEWTALRKALPAYWLPLTTFLIATGVRIGEATAVQVRDLDLDGPTPTVRIRRAWKKGETGVYLGSTKTRRGNRTVRIGHDLAQMLAPIAAEKEAEALVFVGPRGGRVQAQHFRNRVWAPAVERAGITKHLTPHDLRHTSASWLLMAGVEPMVVQHRLGHESLATTSKVYAHLLTDAQAGAANVLDTAVRQIES